VDWILVNFVNLLIVNTITNYNSLCIPVQLYCKYKCDLSVQLCVIMWLTVG